MTEQVRAPRPLADILDAGVRLYRAHFLRLTAVAAIGAVPLVLVQGQLIRALAPGFSIGLIWAISFAITLVTTLIFGSLLSAMLVAAAARAYQGQPIELAATLGIALRSYPRLLPAAFGPLLIERFIGLVAGMFQQPLVMLLISGESPFAVGLLLPLLVALLATPFALGLLWFLGQLFLYVQAVVIEGCTPVAALRRSWELLAANRMRGPLLVAATRMLAHLLVWVPLLTTMFVAFRLLGVPEIYTWLAPVASLAGLLLAAPLLSTIDTVLYYEQAAQLPAGPTAEVGQRSVL